MRNLRDRMEGMLEHAKVELQEAGDLMPVVLVEGRESAIVGIADMPGTADERAALFRAMGYKLAPLLPQIVIAVIDSYAKVGEKTTESLADDPEARDCILVAALGLDGNAAVVMQPYEREPTLQGLEIVWRQPEWLDKDVDPYILIAFFEGVKSAIQDERKRRQL